MTISDFPLPDSLSTEIQVLSDIISLPDTLMDAERILSAEVFTDDRCRDGFIALKEMAKDGMVIDLPSAYGKIDRDLMQKGVIPKMQLSGGAVTAIQHYTTLRDIYIKRKCYFQAMDLFMASCNTKMSSQDLISKVSGMADDLRKEVDTDKGMQHISTVLHELGDTLEELQKDRQSGKMLRIPTGFRTLDFYTYGGFNRGNLIILAARPSVGKTAVMLHMAKSAAIAGKTVNVFSLEMTNAELAQRFLSSESDHMNQWSMAKGDIEWNVFERVSGNLSTKPIYLNDSARSIEDISARIKVNTMSGKCDIAFVDYLGLIKLGNKSNLSQAIAECTGDIKALAKECKIPIVLLCQLNRLSASEKRAPEMHDLRDSGGIEQDADIILMLERSLEDIEGKDVNMWIRKNRQGKAGNLKVTIVANDTFSAFTEKGDDTPPPPTWEDLPCNTSFNDNDIPF